MRLGLLEHGESTGVEAVAQVDDDMVERRPQHGEGTIDVIDGDPRVDVGVRRCGEHPHARGVLGEVAARQLGIPEGLVVIGQHADVIPRRQVEVRGHLAELQVQIHQQRARAGVWSRCRATAGEEHGGVHGQGRGADAALRGEEGGDLAGCRPTLGQGPQASEADEERLHASLELTRRELGAHHVVGAGLEERDAGLDVPGRSHDEHRRRARIGGGVEGANRAGDREALGHDEVDRSVTEGGHCRRRRRHGRDPIAGSRQRLLHPIAQRLGRHAEEDRIGRHRFSARGVTPSGSIRSYRPIARIAASAYTPGRASRQWRRVSCHTGSFLPPPAPHGRRRSQAHREEESAPCADTNSCCCSDRTWRRTSSSPLSRR